MAEAERCLAAGARGIKLHPRAQAFGLAGPVRADLRRWPSRRGVPILIHAGRGLPEAFAAELVEVAQRHPGAPLIMAHVGVADQATMADGLRDHPARRVRQLVDEHDRHAGAVRARPGRADRVRLRSAVRAHVRGAVPDRCARWPASASTPTRAGMCSATRSPRLIDGETLRRSRPRARRSSCCSTRSWRGCTSNLMMVLGRSCPGTRERALDMLWLSLMTCQDANPGDAGPALERIAPLLEASAQSLREQPDVPRLADRSRWCWRWRSPPPRCRRPRSSSQAASRLRSSRLRLWVSDTHEPELTVLWLNCDTATAWLSGILPAESRDGVKHSLVPVLPPRNRPVTPSKGRI